MRWMQEVKRYAPATVSRRLGTVCVFCRYAVYLLAAFMAAAT